MRPTSDTVGNGPRHVGGVERLLAGWEQMSGHYLEGREELLDSIVEHLAKRLAGGTARAPLA